MLGSLLQDVSYGMAQFNRNHWLPFQTPQKLYDDAVSARDAGLVWGAVLGGIGSWIKIVRDRRREA